MSVDFTMKISTDKPVYLQIVLELKRKILSGQVQNGDVLPSRRELAIKLGINPNTAQKAYKQMQEEGIIVTPNNAPSYINVSDELRSLIMNELTEDFVKEFVAQAKKNRLSKEGLLELVDKVWRETK